MCRSAGKALIDMEHMGVTFNRDDEGKLGTRAFGGQRRARTFFVGDFTGQALLHVMFEQLIKSDVRSYEEWFVTSLIIEDGQVGGVTALEIRTGQLHRHPGQDDYFLHRWLRPVVRAFHQRPDCNRRRYGIGLQCRGLADGYGDGAIPPHHPGRQRCAALRGGPR